MLALVRQQGLDILGQVTSLRDMVTELSTGQQTLQSQQSDLQSQLATQAAANVQLVQSMRSLKSDFLTFQAAQDKKFEEERAKYQASMAQLNSLFSEESGVKDPLGKMVTDNA
jgi:peptidoglycan hydrolase CwlO-like protein